jgi:hypothetical protein
VIFSQIYHWKQLLHVRSLFLMTRIALNIESD